MGARREEIINHFYRSRPLATLKLWGRVLARLKSDLDHKLVWSVLTRADFEKTGTTAKDIFEVVDELIVNIPQAKIIVLLYESGNGAKKTEALAYSTTALDSLDLLKAYQPQGGKQLAKIEVNQPIGAAENEIIETIRARLAKLPL